MAEHTDTERIDYWFSGQRPPEVEIIWCPPHWVLLRPPADGVVCDSFRACIDVALDETEELPE